VTSPLLTSTRAETSVNAASLGRSGPIIADAQRAGRRTRWRRGLVTPILAIANLCTGSGLRAALVIDSTMVRAGAHPVAVLLMTTGPGAATVSGCPGYEATIIHRPEPAEAQSRACVRIAAG
jgi:hypothetical protein